MEICQEELFHIFNMMYENEKQIVLTRDVPIKYIPELKTRFECGVFSHISMPDYETKLTILKMYARSLEINIDIKLLHKIAKIRKLNIRELKGILNGLLARSTIYNTIITEKMVDKCLKFYK